MAGRDGQGTDPGALGRRLPKVCADGVHPAPTGEAEGLRAFNFKLMQAEDLGRLQCRRPEVGALLISKGSGAAQGRWWEKQPLGVDPRLVGEEL